MATRTNSNLGTLPFIVDQRTIVKHSGRQIAWPLVPDTFRAGRKTIQLNGAAAAAATSITVDAMDAQTMASLSVGTLLYFGEAGEYARVSAPPSTATAIPVDALPSALEDNDVAGLPGTGKKEILPGKVMTEILTGTYAGKLVPRSDRPSGNTDPATCILETAAAEDDGSVSGYGCLIGGVLYENMLPDSTGTPKVLPTAYKTELQTAGVGTGFGFEQYGDNTV